MVKHPFKNHVNVFLIEIMAKKLEVLADEVQSHKVISAGVTKEKKSAWEKVTSVNSVGEISRPKQKTFDIKISAKSNETCLQLEEDRVPKNFQFWRPELPASLTTQLSLELLIMKTVTFSQQSKIDH